VTSNATTDTPLRRSSAAQYLDDEGDEEVWCASVIRRDVWCVPIASAELDQGLVCGQAAEGLVAGDGERVDVGELVVEGQQPRVAQQTQGVVVIGARSAREVSAALIELERHEGAVVH
jgi:hypothetical protein